MPHLREISRCKSRRIESMPSKVTWSCRDTTFIFNDERSRVTLPGVDNPAIPPEEGLAQPVGIITTAQNATKEVQVLIVNVERHLLQHQVAPQGWTPAEQPVSRPRRKCMKTGER
jgi:hypothetical protein